MLRDSVSVVVVMRTRPPAIPVFMKTMRKSTHGFPFLFYMSVGLSLTALRIRYDQTVARLRIHSLRSDFMNKHSIIFSNCPM